MVPAPCAALVFLGNSSHLTENPGGVGASPTTFSTTFLTRTRGTATVDPSVLATSNGHTGMDSKDELGSTSHGSFSGAEGMKTHLSFFKGLVGSSVIILGLAMTGGWDR
jgi:hypothetical protein